MAGSRRRARLGTHERAEGLSVGKVTLSDGEVVLGVIGEPELVRGQKEISSYGGWRSYIASL